MTTLLYSHSAAAAYPNPRGHAERVERIHAVNAALAAPEFGALVRREAPAGADEEVLRCHPARYLAALRAQVPAEGLVQLDPDTYLAPGTLDAALRAVGGAVAAVDAVLGSEAANAFVAMRPPGHHAETERPMGFCLFGTVAIAAMRALDHHRLARVAVLDFDVHHGNGTQALLWNEGRAFFASSQQMPLWPGTGEASEQGAHGQVMNVGLAPGSGGTEMRRAWGGILTRAAGFKPELVIVSAGFDAHRADPLAELNWDEADYDWLTRAICDLADASARGRVVSCLEGGYDLAALGSSVAAHVAVLMERGR